MRMMASERESVLWAPPKEAPFEMRRTSAVREGSMRMISARSSQFTSPLSRSRRRRGINSKDGGRYSVLRTSESKSMGLKLALSSAGTTRRVRTASTECSSEGLPLILTLIKLQLFPDKYQGGYGEGRASDGRLWEVGLFLVGVHECIVMVRFFNLAVA